MRTNIYRRDLEDDARRLREKFNIDDDPDRAEGVDGQEGPEGALGAPGPQGSVRQQPECEWCNSQFIWTGLIRTLLTDSPNEYLYVLYFISLICSLYSCWISL